jgi:GTP cyclohydrolase I
MSLENKSKMKKMTNGIESGSGGWSMPDIATDQKNALKGTLDWVGMSDIEVPVRLAQGSFIPVAIAKGEAFVNLIDPDAKGIHMSRLYLKLEDALQQSALTPALMRSIIGEFIATHGALSDSAYLSLKFEIGLQRPALKSQRRGFRSYPVFVTAKNIKGEVSVEVGVKVLYSSTCPCSAALARQLIQEQFAQTFSSKDGVKYEEVLEWLGTDKGIVATPHSQRSEAIVLVRLKHDVQEFPFEQMINWAEDALKTPVQAAVKREDEQEFARLNGQNLMFCEDASRKLKSAFNAQEAFADFWIKCIHMESLHPHDAVSTATKGIAGGYSAALRSPF